LKGSGEVAAGIDIGGSNLRVGLVGEDATVLRRLVAKTPWGHDPQEVVEAVVSSLLDVLGEQGLDIHELSGIGIGIPGPVDPVTGTSKLSPNLGWKDIPFGALVRGSFPGSTIAIDNDVRVVTLGEWTYGAGRGARDLMCVTVGTGVGSGLLLQGKPYFGSDGAAGEIGHIQLDPAGPQCGCGNRGCLEQYASGTAVAREARGRGFRAPDGSSGSAQDVAEAAARGEALAAEVLSMAATALARGIAAAVNLLNLERVVIGGGLSRAGPPFWEPFERSFSSQVMPPHLGHVSVVPAALGDDAGILGGACMVRLQERTA
jgi:glucokinase